MKIGQEYWTYYRNPKTSCVSVLLAAFNDALVDHTRISGDY